MEEAPEKTVPPLVLSQHVKERYAERIKGKDDKSSIAVFVAQNEDMIFQNISKMIEYGNLVYTGRSFNKDNNKTVNVYLCHLWILHVDKDTNTVITMYPVDLGLGDDFNKEYVELLKAKIKAETEKWQELKEKAAKQNEEFREIIDSNESHIKDCRKTIKSLEEQNEDYRSLISSSNAQADMAENSVREIIAKLIGKKNFVS